MNTRKSTWLTQELPDYLKLAESFTFTWGVHDCCLFAADAVLALTGTDIAEEFRGKYTDDASALALIHSVTGGTTIIDAIVHCANTHGLVEWKKTDGTPLPLMAQRGDLCAVLNGDGQTIAGIVDCTGRYVACMSEQGLRRFPLKSIQRAWHV